MRRSLLHLVLLLAGPALLALLAACAAEPATQTTPLATPSAPPATVSAADTPQALLMKQPASGCVTCHTDSNALTSLASPTPTPLASAEQKGEG